MKLSNPKEIFDLNDILPPDGEDGVELHYVEGDLKIKLYYQSNDGADYNKTICFYSARHFIKGSFPGFSLFSCEQDTNISLLDSIVEYEESEFLESTLSASFVNDFKHFRVFFHSAGITMHVIAKSVEILDLS